MKIALYRKYRPSTFDEVIGQDVIITTLTNQIKKNAVSHAYLFTGSRGTGKTSCAKIFARAINCLRPKKGSPCGKCEACKALESPSNLDIVEMDAASNNGVDKIRDLRESVGYMPASGKYKVYIIDEVHMLSGSAFNALLKTLEEPPAHVVFVLCTTEVHKLPATILSRCMRFDFKLVPTAKLFKLIKKIFELEGVSAEDDALMHIVRLGEGSVRDTLSIGDRCLNASDKLTYELALEITGTGSSTETAQLMEAVVSSDVGAVLSQVESLAGAGKSITQISRELVVFARDLMLIIAGDTRPTATEDTLKRMQAITARTDLPFLVRFIRTLGGADAELRYSTSPRIVLESALLSLCASVSLTTTAPAPAEQKSGRQAVKQGEQPAPTSLEQKVTPVPATQHHSGSTPDDRTLGVLGYVRSRLRKGGNIRLFGEYSALPDSNVRIAGNDFIVFVDSGSYLTFTEPENMRIVQEILDSNDLGYRLRVERLEDNGASVLDQILEAVGGLEVEVIDTRGKRLK